MQLPGPLLSPTSKKIKNICPPPPPPTPPTKKNLIFPEMKLSSSKTKPFFIFQGMVLFSLIFFLYFRKKLSKLKKYKKHTLKKCLIFQEMELPSLKLKKLLINQEETLKSQA